MDTTGGDDAIALIIQRTILEGLNRLDKLGSGRPRNRILKGLGKAGRKSESNPARSKEDTATTTLSRGSLLRLIYYATAAKMEPEKLGVEIVLAEVERQEVIQTMLMFLLPDIHFPDFA